jgi:hypothetical protein
MTGFFDGFVAIGGEGALARVGRGGRGGRRVGTE